MQDGLFRFENFVVGSANRLAVAAARAVAEAPGAAYNPLYIYSGSGLGKTHLLLASAHYARHLQPGLSALYTTLDEFVDALHGAISAGSVEAFKRRYDTIDLLLLDDVQFLAGRRETQSEMLRLFNVLQQGGRQIVLTSDCPPSEIAGLDDRLITRFSGGLVVDIGEPDYETRVAILRRKCEERGVQFGSGVIEELSRPRVGNVRELQGALNRLVALQTLEGTQVTASTVRAMLGGKGEAVLTADAGEGGGEFESFLSELTDVVAGAVDAWGAPLHNAIAHWSGRGYRTAWLERVLEMDEAPDVDALLAEYEHAVGRLQALEEQGAPIDPALAGSALLRDPERLDEAEQVVARVLAAAAPPPGPDPRLSRATFTVHPSNELAVHAADAVVGEPGVTYNPLFVHGAAGVGKTHLANAVGVGIIERSGGTARVACVAAAAFGDEVIAALQDGSIERWRARYRGLDGLILDDVHELAGKERTQEELFHLFNALHARGKQIILTANRRPGALLDIEERLRSRFEGGLVVELLPPAAQSTGKLARSATTPPRAQPSIDWVKDSVLLDEEKMVWDWPEASDRVIEELA